MPLFLFWLPWIFGRVSRVITYPPDPLPLIIHKGKGEVLERGYAPLNKLTCSMGR